MIRQRGFTLIELLIALAIIGVLTGVAVPLYNGYVHESRERAARTNMESLRLAEEAYFFENRTYLEGTYEPGVADTLRTELGWSPDLDGQRFVYTVTACGAGIASCYRVTVSGFNNKVNCTAEGVLVACARP